MNLSMTQWLPAAFNYQCHYHSFPQQCSMHILCESWGSMQNDDLWHSGRHKSLWEDTRGLWIKLDAAYGEVSSDPVITGYRQITLGPLLTLWTTLDISKPSKCQDHLEFGMNSSLDPGMICCSLCMASPTTTKGAWSLAASTTGDSIGHTCNDVNMLVICSKLYDGWSIAISQKLGDAASKASLYVALVSSSPTAHP